MKVLVVLVLAVFTAGCDANTMSQNHPRQLADMVKDAFWDFVAKETMTAQNILKQLRQSELQKEVRDLVATSQSSVNQFINNLRTQMAPLTQNFMTRFSLEAEQLKVRLEKQLGTRMLPYIEQLTANFQRQVEELQKQGVPYAEAMKGTLQKSQEMKVQLEKSMERLQAQMGPYAEEIREKMEQSLEEFQRSMAPLVQSFESQLAQKTQEIQQNLAAQGEQLKAKLDMDSQNLKKRLEALWKSFTKLTQ
ncbi:apolipoprotein A-IV-like [Parambassis ranga]|uniref:Apolipoprotein A-IV n=1 Tax=Parambassis ranga TaxID=210632 RepID=A0A6P7HSF1_9TELE|nr:apolipoprotein A-IV-like [Parambassis ranga]